jgi:hypothetical protein
VANAKQREQNHEFELANLFFSHCAPRIIAKRSCGCTVALGPTVAIISTNFTKSTSCLEERMTRLTRFLALALVATAALTFPARANGQRGQGRGGDAAAPPVTHQNLKILPADIPQPELLQTMQGFAQGLGVQCGYCHATLAAPEGGARGGGGGQRGRGAAAPQFNYPSDEKPTKNAAREMMLIVRDLNSRVPQAVGKNADASARVQCVTCHRGVAIPKQLGEILAATAMEKGRRQRWHSTRICANSTSAHKPTISARRRL